MLEKVRYADFGSGINTEAYTDGYAYDNYSCLYLLSVAGHDSNVKAITSALVSGRTLEILSDEVIEVCQSFGEKYRILSMKMPSGLLHQIAGAESLLRMDSGREKLLYIGEDSNVANEVYEAVRSSWPVPVIPEWSKWMYRKLCSEGRLEELYGNRKVVKLNTSEELLDDMISEGVRNGEIRFW
jgi:hypothetical protein